MFPKPGKTRISCKKTHVAENNGLKWGFRPASVAVRCNTGFRSERLNCTSSYMCTYWKCQNDTQPQLCTRVAPRSWTSIVLISRLFFILQCCKIFMIKPLVCILWKIYTCLINSIHLNILIESICCVDFFAFHSSVVVNMQITIQHGLETSVQFSEEGFLKILVTCRNCK